MTNSTAIASDLLTLEEFAHNLESMPIVERQVRWREASDEDKTGVLAFLHVEPRKSIFEQCEDSELIKIGIQLTGSELADVFEDLPEHIVEKIVDKLDKDRKDLYRTVSQFETDEVGRYLTEDMFTLPVNTSLERAQRMMRGKRLAYATHVFIASKNNRLIGSVSLQSLSERQTDASLVNHILDSNVVPLSGNTKIEEAVTALEASGFSSLPVIDIDGRLLGTFTMHSAMHFQRQQAETMLMSTAGLNDDDDIFSPLRRSISDRAIWLGINLVTAILASLFIGLFEDSISKIVALAVLMPIVASMGGITGSQTLSTVIRRMALEQITQDNQSQILSRELKIGMINGVLWAIVGGLLAYFWFEDFRVGAALAIGLLINISVAAWCGMTIPLMLKKYGIDPAVSGSVILTTITDIVGFVSFLGTATVLLLIMS